MLLFPCHPDCIFVASSHFTMLPNYFLTEAMSFLFQIMKNFGLTIGFIKTNVKNQRGNEFIISLENNAISNMALSNCFH